MALRIPERLVVTLDRIFEDGAVAELLTTNKLSELACLALYLWVAAPRGAVYFLYCICVPLSALRSCPCLPLGRPSLRGKPRWHRVAGP